MSTLARKLVSRGKKRFVDHETSTNLDLAYITDRVIIMGWPGQGLTAFFRNSMQDVLKFLEARHGRKWHIFNFCPRVENSYDKDAVYGQVTRFPFPDHHAPPLGLIAVFVDCIRSWLDADPENVAVIHCKAGKGRSGTMTVSYLLSLPTLPRPPQNARNYSKGRAPPASSSRSSLSDDETSLNRNDSHHAIHDAKGKQRAERLTDHLGASEDVELVEEPANGIGSPDDHVNLDQVDDKQDTPSSDKVEPSAAAAESADIAEKLRFVFALHTEQRMQAAKEGKYGISIASQRRFVGYWARILAGDDPRPWLQPEALREPSSVKRRSVRLMKIELHMADKLKGVPPPLDSKRVSVVVTRYRDAYQAQAEERERDYRRRKLDAKEGAPETKEDWNDDRWQDQSDMFSFIGRLVQHKHDLADDALGEQGVRTLLPKEEEGITAQGGIEIDADRQILLKILVGQTGTKHDLLPDVASLGYAWVIPSFESAPVAGQSFAWELAPAEIDFLKPQAGFKRAVVHWEST